MKEEVENLNQENQRLSDQIKKLRRELRENQEYLDKVEQGEKLLRNQLKEQD